MKNATLTFLLLLSLASIHSLAQAPEKVADIPNYAFNAYYPYISGSNNADYYNSVYYNATNANFTVAGNLLFFTVYNTLSGYELWVTDGSSTGTTMIQIVAPPNQYFSFSNFTAFNNRLYFIGTTQWGSILWVSNGTPQGTQKLTYLNQHSNQFLMVWKNQLYLLGSEPNAGYHLFTVSSDSLPLQAAVDLSSLGIINALLFNNKLYITSADSANQYLWVTDGSENGTSIIKQVARETYNIWVPSNYNSSMNVNLQECNGKLWFFTEQALWVSDGTGAGTTMVPNSNYYNQMDADFVELENVAVAGDNIYYVLYGEDEPGDCGGGGTDLVVCNGDSVRVLLGGLESFDLNNGWANLNGRLYFSGTSVAARYRSKNQLWASDGTVSGTAMVDTLLYNPSTDYTLSTLCYWTTGQEVLDNYPGANVCGFNAINNKIYFISMDGNNDGEVWVYNGDSATTTEIIPANATNCSPLWLNSSFTEYKKAVYYLASYTTSGQELWRINLPTAKDSISSNSGFSLYPNPAHASINISTPSADIIYVYNLLGEVVKTQNVMPADIIDISGFANGVYVIRNGENTLKAKFVKE